MKLFKPGRQGSGYLKLKIISFWFFDLYILKYPEGSEIPSHRDPVPGKRHFRVNFELKKASAGGLFSADKHIFRLGRLCFFRSDESSHQVTKIEKGTRWVLSLGYVLKEAKK